MQAAGSRVGFTWSHPHAVGLAWIALRKYELHVFICQAGRKCIVIFSGGVGSLPLHQAFDSLLPIHYYLLASLLLGFILSPIHFLFCTLSSAGRKDVETWK